MLEFSVNVNFLQQKRHSEISLLFFLLFGLQIYEGELSPTTSIVFGVLRSVPCRSSYTLVSLAKQWWLKAVTASFCISTLTTARCTSPHLSATHQPPSTNLPALSDMAAWTSLLPVSWNWIPWSQKSDGWGPSTSGQNHHSVYASSVNLSQSGQHSLWVVTLALSSTGCC